MPQHFLLSAACRDLCTYQISKMSADDAFRYLVAIRWGEETQVCPSCGSVNRHYFRGSRKQWRCRDCDYCFSVLSGTVFSDHKMPYDKLLLGMSIYISSAKGVSATQLARQLDVQVRTAHVFSGKLRECLLRTRDTSLLAGEVQIDGSHICGKPRKPNRRKKATPEAIAFQIKQQAQKKKGGKSVLKGNFNPQNIEKRKKRRIVMAMRSIDPEKGMGAKRTIVSVAMTENERDATALAHRYISPDASTFIMTDECSAYSALSRWWEHHTVVHANEFSSPEGYNENQAESYFSRLKRSEVGTFHRMEPKYLMDYANEMAWREDVRRMSEGQKLKELLEKIFRSGRSRWWRGYFQGHHRKMELLML